MKHEPTRLALRNSRIRPSSVLLALLFLSSFMGITEHRIPAHLGQIAAVIPIGLAVVLSVRNAIRSQYVGRLYWALLAIGCALWAVHQFTWEFVEGEQFGHTTGTFVSDSALFLHIVIFLGALVLRPDLKTSRLDLYERSLNCLRLLLFWTLVYGYYVLPFDVLIPEASIYDFRLRLMIWIQSCLFAVAAGFVVHRTSGHWRERYWRLFGSSVLYALAVGAQILPNVPLATGRSSFFFLEQISACWFVWYAVMEPTALGPESEPSSRVKTPSTVWGVLTAVAIASLALWELSRADEPPELKLFRLILIIASTVLFGPFILREHIGELTLRETTNRSRLQAILANAAAIASGRRYEEVVETVPAIVWRADPQTRSLTYVNGKIESLLGFAPDEWVKKSRSWSESVHHNDRETFERMLSLATAEENQQLGFEHRAIAADGRTVWLKTTVSPVYESGELTELVGVSIDVTHEKMAEQSLRQSEEALRSSERRLLPYLQQNLLGVIEWDGLGRVQQWNAAACKIFGYTREEAIGRKASDLIVPDDLRDKIHALYMSLLTDIGGRYTLNENIRRDGTRIVCEWFNTPIKTGNSISGVFSLVHDVTNEKLAEQTLRDFSGRLLAAQEEERRRIARELHDDIGQDIAILSMKIYGSGSETKEELLRRAKEVGHKVSRLSHELHSSQLELLGLSAAIRIASREFSESTNIQVTCDCPEQVPLADKTIALSLYRVLQESLHNIGKHSRADHATVEMVSTENYITLVISDNGCGFETTSASSRTGLGLTSMRERVRAAGGDLIVSSSPGKGTRIEAHVPSAIRKEGLSALVFPQ